MMAPRRAGKPTGTKSSPPLAPPPKPAGRERDRERGCRGNSAAAWRPTAAAGCHVAHANPPGWTESVSPSERRLPRGRRASFGLPRRPWSRLCLSASSVRSTAPLLFCCCCRRCCRSRSSGKLTGASRGTGIIHYEGRGATKAAGFSRQLRSTVPSGLQ